MSSKKESDYKSLASLRKKGEANSPEQTSLKPLESSKTQSHEPKHSSSLINPYRSTPEEFPSEPFFETSHEKKAEQTEIFVSDTPPIEDLPFAEQVKRRKEIKSSDRDRDLLGGENWLRRTGHTLSYIGLYLFSILVLFRPYELVPGLGFLSATAFYFAFATLAIYIPTQLATEGNITTFSTEVKAILALTAISILTMPIAKDPGMAWEHFNDPFIKAVLIFIVMVNVIRTRARLLGMIWLSLSIGVVLSYLALGMYMRGEMTVEGYRVGEVIGGMFENPNEMSMHLIMMIPIAVALGLGTRNKVMKIVYFATAILMISANFITFSRGGFLGLMGSMGVLAWKLGRKNRLNVTIVGVIATALTLLLAPGNFGIRVLSIFIPGLDAVGSSDQRKELLERSIIVTLRNPWGIGIGNFPIVGIRNLVSHNAYTQVSAELGLLGLAAYLVFMISPFRKLGAIERTLFAKDDHGWFYYLAVGLQSSIVAYMISSFFASVAYNWFIYYLIAYAVAFRRVYSLETEE
ncbi:MAG: hypothetical protein IPK58_05915 [Acidobacteria bacterium]|nr:hypothetical protein [Acidobacteriota bacterium]